ncbi:MAG: hypothetical protein KGH89_07805 [Thaumarchaeota archaeon]|nr:hypothetical protein [Nitrososphaerota archaeon]MDE1868133.1 hypothetical protein [Nitrososphaerota archaeon]
MEKVKIPRDWSRVRDAIVSRILGFTTTSANAKPYRDKKGDLVIPMGHDGAWLIICMMLSTLIFAGIFRISGMSLAETQTEFPKYDAEWIFLIMVLFLLPRIVFRGILGYRDIPKGWTREQAEAFFNLQGARSRWKSLLEEVLAWFPLITCFKIINNVGKQVGGKDWKFGRWLVTVFAWMVGYYAFFRLVFWVESYVKDATLSTLLPISAIVFAIIAPIVYARKKYLTHFKNNKRSLVEAYMEIKHGRRWRVWLYAFIGVGLCGVPLMMYFGIDKLLFSVPAYFGLLVFCALKGRGKLRRKN